MGQGRLLRVSVALLLAVGGLAAEACLLLELALVPAAPRPLHLVSLLGLHLFAAAALAEAARLRYRRGQAGAASAWRIAALLTLLLPPFGALLALVLVLLPPPPAPAAQAAELSPMESRRQQAEAELARELEQGVAEPDIEVLGEALKDEQKDKRIGAVEALKSIANKEAVELLGRSLNNTVFDVRFHAVEALTVIGKKFSGRIALAQQRLEAEASAENEIALGRIYFEYASLEMEEESVQQHLYRNAVHHLAAGIERAPAVGDEVRLELAMSHERSGGLNEARQVYAQILSRDGQSYGALLGLARVQFAEADFAQLSRTCRQILEVPSGDPRHVELLRFWAERAR